MNLDKLFPKLSDEERELFGETFLGQHPFIAVAKKLEWRSEHRFRDYKARPYADAYYPGHYPITEAHEKKLKRYGAPNYDAVSEGGLYDQFQDWFWGYPSHKENLGKDYGIDVMSYSYKRLYLDTKAEQEEVEEAIELLRKGPPVFEGPSKPEEPNEHASDAEWDAFQKLHDEFTRAWDDYEELLSQYKQAEHLADTHLEDFQNWLKFCADLEARLENIDETILDWLQNEIAHYQGEWLERKWDAYWTPIFQKTSYKPLHVKRKCANVKAPPLNFIHARALAA